MTALRTMMRYMRPYRLIVFVGILTVILPVTMELIVPRMLQFVVDDGIRAGNMDAILCGSLVMIGAAVISAIATLGQGVARARLSQGMAFDMRNDLFKHIQSLPFATLDQLQTGGLMTRISSDVDVIRMFSSNGLALLLRALLMIFGSTIMIIATDWQLSIIMVVCLSVAGLVIWNFMRMASPLFAVVQQKLSSLNTLVQENLAGRHVVKAFVREEHAIERFGAGNADYMAQNIRVGRILSLVMPILTVMTNLGVVAVIWFGGLDVIGGRLTIGELIAFNNYLTIGMTPLLLLGNMVTMASRAEASSARVLAVFNQPPQEQAGERAHRADHVRGAIVFDDVSFQYGARRSDDLLNSDQSVPTNGHGQIEVLHHVSFGVQPGQRIALLGATGSGKSTLVNLISRFYEVTGGRILVDGVDVRQWDPEVLRSQIGTVMQEPILFSGTVRENIAYGKPDAALEDIITASQAAQAHEFITRMPEGYDSMIEARGANLSGGQKQRLAIARAILIRPGVLILDDSTSAVDLETEIQIQDALDALMKETTTLIIAQRINSVLTADQIILLDHGQIAAMGNHETLMRTSSIYQEIYQSQFGTEFLDPAN